jgi:hypothetical protein
MPKVLTPLSFEAQTDIYMAKAKVNNTDMVHRLGTSWPTWCRWKKSPGSMPMIAFREYCRILRLDAEDITEILRSI